MQYRPGVGYEIRTGAEPSSSHDAEVGVFLRRSQNTVKRLTERIEHVQGYLTVSEARRQAFLARSERFVKHLELIRASLGQSPSVVRAEPEDSGCALAPNGETGALPRTDPRLEATLLETRESLYLACEELRQARRLLEREHAKFVNLLENEPVATLITDERSTVRDANRAAAATLGVEPQKLPGKLLVAFVARQDVDDFHMFTRPLWNLPGGEARSVTLRIRPRGQAVMRARLSVSPVVGVSQTRVALRWTIAREVAAA